MGPRYARGVTAGLTLRQAQGDERERVALALVMLSLSKHGPLQRSGAYLPVGAGTGGATGAPGGGGAGAAGGGAGAPGG